MARDGHVRWRSRVSCVRRWWWARWRTWRNEATMSAASKALMNIVQVSLASVGRRRIKKFWLRKELFKSERWRRRALRRMWYFTSNTLFDSCFGSFSLPSYPVSHSELLLQYVFHWDRDRRTLYLESMCEMSLLQGWHDGLSTKWTCRAPRFILARRRHSSRRNEFHATYAILCAASKTWNLTHDKQWRWVSCQKLIVERLSLF